jgi:hypothetical protein
VCCGAPHNSTLEARGPQGLYSAAMDSKHTVEMPGVEFVIDRRGRRKAVLIDLHKHGPLWEDVYDAYLVQRRCKEPRESLAKVKRLLQRSVARRERA